MSKLTSGPTIGLRPVQLGALAVSPMPFTVGGQVPLAARQGRDLQRYGSQGERLVAGCSPTQLWQHPAALVLFPWAGSTQQLACLAGAYPSGSGCKPAGCPLLRSSSSPAGTVAQGSSSPRRATSHLLSTPSPPEPLLTCCSMQGGWEKDETVEDAAARETVEEAGVRGRLEVCVLLGSLLKGQDTPKC